MMCQHHPIAKATAVAALLLATAGPAFAQTTDQDRHQRGEAMIRTLNAGESQATLEGLRREFPFLADAITGYAIGDVWARPVLDHRAHQIAAVSAFAALGNRTFMKIHAGYALNLGVSEDDLKEVVYLTTVHYAAGSDAVEVILGKITTMRNEIERWRELSVSTDLVVEKHCNREV